jgi:hypothetical protein
MPDYSKGKIYKITSPSHPGECYIGSTVRTLEVRLAQHKSDYKYKRKESSSKLITCYGDAIIRLIELYPCASMKELNRREGFYIREHMNNDEMDDVVNINIAGRTEAEWRKDNKKYLQNWFKEYYDTHKDHRAHIGKVYRINKKSEIKIKRSIKINCEFCGELRNKDSIRRHQRSKKCQAIQEQKSKNLGSVAWSSSLPPSLTPGTS